MKRFESVVRKVAGAREAVDRRTRAWCAAVRSRLADTRGQGTTEYAILVGVPTKQHNVLDNKPQSKSSLSVSIHTKLDNILAKKREIGGLPCFR